MKIQNDLINKKFHYLTALSYDHSKNKRVFWKFKCRCGKIIIARLTAVKTGNTKSCGCLLKENIFKKRSTDITGKTYGRLVAVEYAHKVHKSLFWKFKCICGNEKIINKGAVIRGDIKSCGCLQKELLKINRPKAFIDRTLSAKKRLYKLYVNSATQRSLAFELTFEKFIELTQLKCFYCELKPSQVCKSSQTSSYVYNGLDRKNNQIGYLLTNIVPCCKFCNQAKSKLSIEEFFDNIERVYKYQINRIR